MNKLHLVGFTTDLKSLVFARRKGSKTGSFLVPIDDRLRRTLGEVEKLEEVEEQEAAEGSGDGKAPSQVPASKLSPKEIQARLREGKSAEEVAKVAETDVSWIQKFTGPIVAEKGGVIDAVRGAVISKPRLGESALPAGEAVEVNLLEKRVNVPQEIIDDSWNAVKRGEEWEVTFRYVSRGRVQVAAFSYDPETRETRATNGVARGIAWRSPDAPTPDEVAAKSSGGGGARKKKSSSRRGAKRKGSKRSSKKKSPRKKAPGSKKKPSGSRKKSSGAKKKPGSRKKSSGGRPRAGGRGSRRSKG